MTRKAVLLTLLIVVLPFTTVLTRLKSGPNTNAQSRLATMESLVHRQSFIIDESKYVGTIDKARLENGHFVSEKPPLWTVFGAGVYALIWKNTGRTFEIDDEFVIKLLSFSLGWLPLLLGFIYFRKLCKLIYLDRGQTRNYWLAQASFTLGFIGMGYATTISNHVPAASFLIAAFYHAFRMVRYEESARRGHWFWLGFWAALAPTLDLPALFVSVGLVLYAVTSIRLPRIKIFNARNFFFLCLGAIPILVLHFYLNHLATGYWLPMYFREDLIFYPGSYWDNPQGLDRMADTRFVYFLQILFGFRGVFSHTPILFFWAALVVAVLGSFKTQFRKEILLSAILFVVLILFYVIQSPNKYGGTCVGFRFMILVLPLLLLWVPIWFERARSKLAWASFAVAFFVSFYVVFGAIVEPWRNGEIEKVMRGIGLVVIPS